MQTTLITTIATYITDDDDQITVTFDQRPGRFWVKRSEEEICALLKEVFHSGKAVEIDYELQDQEIVDAKRR